MNTDIMHLRKSDTARDPCVAFFVLQACFRTFGYSTQFFKMSRLESLSSRRCRLYSLNRLVSAALESLITEEVAPICRLFRLWGRSRVCVDSEEWRTEHLLQIMNQS